MRRVPVSHSSTSALLFNRLMYGFGARTLRPYLPVVLGNSQHFEGHAGGFFDMCNMPLFGS
jgi:hypothetical protein